MRRERVGLQEETGQRGSQVAAATVEESLGRLREVDGRFKVFHEGAAPTAEGTGGEAESTARHGEEQGERKLFKEGRLIHRAEAELKTHTSYLLFALLPQEWSAEEEEQACQRWPVLANETPVDSSRGHLSGRQLKRAGRAADMQTEQAGDGDVATSEARQHRDTDDVG